MKTEPCKRQKNKKLALELGIQTYQILTNDDEVCIPSLSSILLAVLFATFWQVVSFPDLQMQRSGQSLNGWQESTNFRSFQMETNSELGHFHFRFLKTMWNSTKRAIICNNLKSFKSKLSNLHIFHKTNEILSIFVLSWNR